MKAFYEVTFPSWGIARVAFQLAKFAPPQITAASDPDAADLLVLHVMGRRDHMLHWAKEMLANGKKYAVIQYVLQSSRNPDPKDWQELWKNAVCVWSYYDLHAYMGDNFYHAPLAADPAKFFPQPDVPKKYLVGTNGADYARECVGELRLAAWRAGGKTVHMGQKLNDDPNVDYFKDITDEEIARLYNACWYWGALRRKDGFELPCVEALFCGVRPIVFDTPNYHQWFDGLAEFVPELDSEKLTMKLERLFKNGTNLLSPAEVAEANERFNWQRIITGFWQRCTT
jgi:hypothetical protein